MPLAGGALGTLMFGGHAYPPYHRELLALARTLRAEQRLEMAVIAAAMGCELLTDIVIKALLTRAGVERLRDPIGGFITSFNLNNERVYDLYEALDGGGVRQQQFWRGYKQLIKTRNDVVHVGNRVGAGVVDDILTAAEDYLPYMEGRL